MAKRIVIAGCRNFNDYRQAEEFIDLCLKEIRKNDEIIFVSGGCKGADLLGEKYAIKNGFEIERYPAEWAKYGRAAGPMRNQKMAEVCDYVICFWDGQSKGTKSMINYARKYKKQVMIKEIKKY